MHTDWPAILPSSKEVKGFEKEPVNSEEWLAAAFISFMPRCGWIGKPLLSRLLSVRCCSSTKGRSWLSRTFPALWIVAFELKLEYYQRIGNTQPCPNNSKSSETCTGTRETTTKLESHRFEFGCYLVERKKCEELNRTSFSSEVHVRILTKRKTRNIWPLAHSPHFEAAARLTKLPT